MVLMRNLVTILALLGGPGVDAQTTDIPLIVSKDLPPGMVAPKNIDRPSGGMYPPLAVRCHLVGKAVLELLVYADGSVGSAKIVTTTGYKILDEAAENFASKFHYLPATLNGVPIASRIDLILNFITGVKRKSYCDNYPETFPDTVSPAK